MNLAGQQTKRLHLSNDHEAWHTDISDESLGQLLKVRHITSHTYYSI
jgi:hypothetical protein